MSSRQNAIKPPASLPALAESLAATFPGSDDAPLARDLLRMLARGRPVAAARLAAAAGRDEADARAALARWPNVHRDDSGRVVAFGGLSLRPTTHRFDAGGRRLYTWCAWDTLFLPRLLGSRARVESTCPITGADVRLEIDPEQVLEWQPGELWVSFPPSSHASAEDITGSFCCHVHFLAGASARDRWLARNDRGLTLGLDQAFELGRLATVALTSPDAPSGESDLMTVGELSRRTGLSVKAIREYEGMGLIYSAGRSEGGYRLFDESALWCAGVIEQLRAVGLTIKEIKRIGDAYLANPDEPVGPMIAAALDRAERRTAAQLAELQALRRRIRDYRADNAAALAGLPGAPFGAPDPRRVA